MEFLKETPKFDYLGWQRFWIALSIVFVGFSVYLWFARGDTKFGVDFRGGNEFVVKFAQPIEIKQVREALEKGGFADALVQNFEGEANEFSIRLGAADAIEVSAKVRQILSAIPENSYEILKEDFVGPVIGEKIRRDAIIAFFISIIGIFIYVTVQFGVPFAIGAIVALLHDGIVATGVTILVGKQLGAHTLAAVLTIVGYSVNDTIVIFDRIRENLALASKSGTAAKKGAAEKVRFLSLEEIMNLSINETLSRTILTAITVLFICLTLWLAGGGAVSDLAFTLLIGAIAGMYSTVFIACPVVLMFGGGKNRDSDEKNKK